MRKKYTLTTTLQFLLSLTLFLLPWQTIWIVSERTLEGDKWQYGTIGFYIIEALLWITVAVFIVWFWKERNKQHAIEQFSLTKDRLFLFCSMVFVGFLYVSSLWAPASDIAIQQAQRVMGSYIFFIMLFVGPLSAKKAVWWFVAGAVVQSAFGLWQFVFQTTLASTVLGLAVHPVNEPGTSVVVNESGRWLRAYGSFAHPNIFGGYLVMALFAANMWQQIQKRNHIVTVGMYTLLSMGIFVSFSRSAWIAVAVIWCIEAYGYVIKKKKTRLRFLVTTIAVFVLCVSVTSSLVHTRLFGGSSHENYSTQVRLTGVGEALALWKEAPLFGVGAGNYTAAAFLFDSSQPGWLYQPVHNIDLLLLVELGLVGGLLFLLAFYYFLEVWVLIAGKQNIWIPLLLIFIIAPMAIFDHYLWTSFAGLLSAAAFFGILLRKDGYLSTV